MHELLRKFANLPVEGWLKILVKYNKPKYKWNMVLNKFLGEGNIKDAYYLFNRMPHDVMYSTTMITGLCRFGKVKEARQLFDEMRVKDTMAWTSMITGYAHNSCLEEAHTLLNRMPIKDSVPVKILIRKYMQCGKVSEALKLFEENGKSDLQTCNSMLIGFCQNGMISDARNFFNRMNQRNVFTWTSLISGYVETKNLEVARQLFDEMPTRNVVSWTVMLSGYANNGKMEEAEELFDKMPVKNVVGWNSMISGYAKVGELDKARKLFDVMPERDGISWTAMVTGYALNGKIEDAKGIFDQSPTKDVVSWNAVIAGYAQNGYGEEALRMFVRMKRIRIKPNESTFVSVLSACGFLSAIEEGKQIHEHIIREELRSHCPLDNALVAMYSKCGNIGDAKKCFEKTSKPDVVTWNAMIAGYAQHGLANEALDILEKMLASETKPNSATFVGGLKACSHAGLVDQGTSYFLLMRHVYGIEPTVEHYGCMVDLLGRAGQLEEARDMINTMPFEADAIVWGSLLGACRVHRNPEMGKWAAENLIKLRPQDATAYVLLSHIYSAAGMWEEARQVRSLMSEKQVKKDPGCSWIQLKDQVHSFVMGDRSHPQTKEIYFKLQNLSTCLEKAGYVPEACLVLHDIEEEHKGQLLLHHSEKLALAFGLISTVPETTIRIIKNLRVCVDCHTAIKLISEIENREIILRDINRFHHFKGGSCSCNDYW